MDYNGKIWNKSDSGRFSKIHAYSDILWHIQEYSVRHDQDYSGIFRTLRKLTYLNPGIFKILSNSELESYSESLQSVLVVHMLYEINIMNIFNTKSNFNPIVFTVCKKSNQYSRAMNFDIPWKGQNIKQILIFLKQTRLKTVGRLNWNKKQWFRSGP